MRKWYERGVFYHITHGIQQYLSDTIRLCIDTFNIHGIGLDCANVLNFGFLKELREQTFGMKEGYWLTGEVIHGEYGRWVNNEMLHSVTDYELHKSIYSGHSDHNYFEIAHNLKRLEAIGLQLYAFLDNPEEVFPVRDHRIVLNIPANRGVILKIMEG